MPGLRAIWALCVTTSNIYDLVFGNSGPIIWDLFLFIRGLGLSFSRTVGKSSVKISNQSLNGGILKRLLQNNLNQEKNDRLIA